MNLTKIALLASALPIVVVAQSASIEPLGLLSRIEAQQSRVAGLRLAASGSVNATYALEKAQCWLDFSRHQKKWLQLERW